MKRISWNCVSLELPKDWEVTLEGGTRYNGFLTIAPPEGCKLEIYWRASKGGVKQHDAYIKKLVKRGFESRRKSGFKIKGHEAQLEVLEKDNYRVVVSTWFCDHSRRFFITQLDGTKASLPIFTDIVNTINCHLCDETMIPWEMMGLGLKLYNDYYVYMREFKIGYTMGLFLSNDKRVTVLQYGIAKYVIDSDNRILEEARERALKLLLPRFTRLHPIDKDSIVTYSIISVLTGRIRYGYLVERTIECFKPPYLQTTFIKVSKKERLNEARDIAESSYCTEW